MSEKDDQVRSVLSEQAAGWFVANREDPGPAEREEFLKWLRSSSMHVEEYLGVTQVAQDLMVCPPEAQAVIEALLERTRRDADSVVQPLDPSLPRAGTPPKTS